MPASKREHLLEIAAELFENEGFRGVSVDRIVEEAGVAKMTLYKGFGGKTQVILKCFELRAQQLSLQIENAIDAVEGDADARLLCVFDAMEHWTNRPNANGCFFVNALSEYAGVQCEEAKAARLYKSRFLRTLEKLSRDCEVKDAKEFAKVLFLLIEGATVARVSLRDKKTFKRAKAVAASLLERRK